MSSIVKWKNKETLTFIKLLSSRPCLWDPEHPEYNNIIARRNNIAVIVSRMAVPWLDEEEAESTLKNIRRTYHEELYKSLNYAAYAPLYWFALADSFMRKAALKYTWVESITGDNDREWSVHAMALEGWPLYEQLDRRQQRVYKQACLITLNRLLDEQIAPEGSR